MKQFSIDNSPVELELLSGHLLFVDPVYFQDIIDGISHVDRSSVTDKRELVRILEEKLFPYGGGGLLGYKFFSRHPGNLIFDPNILRKWEGDNNDQDLRVSQKQITTFAVDSGSFLIIDLDNFERLIQYLTYDSLINALLHEQLGKYVEQVNNELGNKGWAYVVSEGIETNSEFDGDGAYIIV